MTEGETWGADVPRAKLYSAPDGGELSMVFQFEHMCLDQTTWEKWDEVPFELPEAYYGAETLISNYEGDCPVLRPYEAMMLYYEGLQR